jgi:hypothetical protein
VATGGAGPDRAPGAGEEPPRPGSVRPTSRRLMVAIAVLGTAIGWTLVVAIEASGGVAPTVSWLTPVAWGFLAALLFVAVGASVLVRHQLLVERLAHSDDRVHLAQDYSRLTNARVVENAEFVDLMHRRLDGIDERLDKIDQEVATVLAAGDKHSAADAPTVVDLKLRGLAAS